MAILGTHNIQYIDFEGKKKLVKKTEEPMKAPGRIIRFVDDRSYQNGTIFLTDDVKDDDDYIQRDGCDLYTFPFEEDPA